MLTWFKEFLKKYFLLKANYYNNWRPEVNYDLYAIPVMLSYCNTNLRWHGGRIWTSGLLVGQQIKEFLGHLSSVLRYLWWHMDLIFGLHSELNNWHFDHSLFTSGLQLIKDTIHMNVWHYNLTFFSSMDTNFSCICFF